MKPNISRFGIILAIVFWIVDALIDSILSQDLGFFDSCFLPGGEELWIRSFVVLLFLIFSAYTERLMKIINNMTTELQQYHDRLEYTVTELQMEITERKAAIEELEKLAITDPLTAIFNRRKFNELLEYEIDRTLRYQSGLSIIMCDIDHFKIINDQFGHDTGDDVLKAFVKTIGSNIRDVDVFARWGGEEFMILMPSVTLDTASGVAEKLRHLIKITPIEGIDTLTASFGVTQFNSSDNIDSFLKRVDQALYQAKQNGRNTVVTLDHIRVTSNISSIR